MDSWGQGVIAAAAAAAVLAGMAQATQAVYNNAVAKAIGGTLPAALVSMIVAAVILACVMLVRQVPFPGLGLLKASAPYPLFVGGLCGSVILMAVLFAVPTLGSASVIVLFILGQLLASVVLNHLGTMGIAVHPVSLLRLGGVALVLCGAVLVIRG